MVCHSLKSLANTEILSSSLVLERIELETPQVIYLFVCSACNSIHSLEFSVLDREPELITDLRKAA